MKKTKPNYSIRRAEQREITLPGIDLLPVIEHNGRKLDVAVFGENTYRGNISEMEKRHFYSRQFPDICFRPATTSESISTASHGFGSGREFDAKRDIINPEWLQLGYIVRTQDGVFTNTDITDGTRLKQLLNKAKKVKGIYLLNDKIAFAPYETFKADMQDSGDFSEGGLARALEHTKEKTAKNLRKMSSLEFYENGVNVINFNDFRKHFLTVAGLASSTDFGGGGLNVVCDGLLDYLDGYAFGVLK